MRCVCVRARENACVSACGVNIKFTVCNVHYLPVGGVFVKLPSKGHELYLSSSQNSASHCFRISSFCKQLMLFL